MKYIVVDWAGNILDYTQTFKLPQFAVGLTFDSFDEGWDYLYTFYHEDDHCNYNVIEEGL